MASTPPASFNPIQRSKETILGMTIALEQRFGITPRNDFGTTLNSKFNVFPTRAPANNRIVRYFCWGVGGKVNDTTTLTSAQKILGTNMAPYAIRPFRAVPFEEDLTIDERANYAMRVVTTINGTPYCLYYLKRIDFGQSSVQYVRTDPTSGVVTEYVIDYTNLSPTAPVADSNGVVTDVSDSVSVIVPGVLTVTGQEALESASVIDQGDPRYAVISEFGLVSASTESVQASNANGQPFPYNEAIMAQMTDHYTFTGFGLSSTTDNWTRTMRFSCRNLINA